MDPRLPEITGRKAIRALFHTFLFDTAIALFLTGIKFGHGFVLNFIFSQCIGLTICSCMLISFHLLKPTRPLVQLLLLVAAMTLGSVTGTLLAMGVAIMSISGIQFRTYDHTLTAVFLGLIFGSVIIYVFRSRDRIATTEAMIQDERIRRLTSEKRLAETRLKILQAQIEPHFLFNTLSNILGLVDREPEKGKTMLQDLIRYLRASLSRTRDDTSTLGQEMELIEAYFNIFQVRMGDRLRYRIHLPEGLRNCPFPPMLLQPLVENAITHGIEPKIEGGCVSVGVEETEGRLHIEVVDTGLGFHPEGDAGLGLSNTRERLQSLYGAAGRLILEENRPSGLKVTVEVPHEADPGDHR